MIYYEIEKSQLMKQEKCRIQRDIQNAEVVLHRLFTFNIDISDLRKYFLLIFFQNS